MHMLDVRLVCTLALLAVACGGGGGDGFVPIAEGTGSAATDDPTATTTASATGSASAASNSAGDSADDTGPKLDVGDDTASGCAEGGGGGGSGDIEFSNIWIANSPDGTVSKIDTITATEIGRYQVTPMPANNVLVGPSRTSVSLRGDMVVADRSGGLAKVWAREEDCVDRNGNGTIETSNGATALPYDTDECVAWRIEIPRMPGVYEDRRGPRAVQWTVPNDLENCELDDADVWVAFCNAGDDDATVWRVDGDTSDVLVEIPIAGFQCEMMGPYGGAIDADNALWFIENDTRKAIYRVDHDCEPSPMNPCWEVFDRPDADMDNYGITADAMGRVWVAGQNNSLYYYWPAENEWLNLKPELDAFFAAEAAARPDGAALANNILRGLMMDEHDRLWVATVQDFGGGPYAGVLEVDTSTSPFTLRYHSKEVLGPELQHAAGISIDVEGHVWLVDTFSNGAYKIPPDNPAGYTRVGGLNQPYTYSDMTGYGLTQVAFPPQG
jgi:hypothetical protein